MSTTPNEREAIEAEVALIEKAALRVGMKSLMNHGAASCVYTEGCNGVSQEHLIAFAREVALHCVAALAEARSSLPPSDHIGDGNKMVSEAAIDAAFLAFIEANPGELSVNALPSIKKMLALAAAGAKPEPEGEAVAWEVTNAKLRYWTVTKDMQVAFGIEREHRDAGYPQTIVRPLFHAALSTQHAEQGKGADHG